MRTIIEKAKKEKFPLYAAFLDLRKAYDSVNRKMLWDKLESLGLDDRSIDILKSLYRNNTRQIKIGRDTTKPLRCTRGVRQGCPLSPTLFALFTQDLPDTLSQKTQGVPLGDTRVNIICYADDIMLVAQNKEDLNQQIDTVITEIEKRDLEINFDKSAIMIMNEERITENTKGNTNDKQWEIKTKIRRHSQTAKIKIKIVEEYKYLGIILHNKEGFKQHREKKTGTLRMKLGMMKARCGQTEDRLMTGRAMWSSMMTKNATFGANVIPTTKTWRTQLDRIHWQAGRWIVGASQNTSHERIAKELGWASLETEINIGKLCYLARAMKMEESRWPKIALRDMQRRGAQYTYIKEMQGLKLKYNIPHSIITVQNHGYNIRRHIKHIESTKNPNPNTNTQECQHQGPTPEHKNKYLGTYKSKLWLRRARTHDWWNLLGGPQRKTCPICSTQTNCIINHIIKSEGHCGKENQSQNEIECESLWNGSEEDQRKINGWIREWVETRKKDSNRLREVQPTQQEPDNTTGNTQHPTPIII